MHPWFIPYFFDFGHPCYGQFTPVNTRYLLTSIMWLYYRLKFRAYRGHLFLKLTADQVQVFFGLWAHVRLTCCNHWQVVWKPVYSNPVLKKLTEVYVFLVYKYYFVCFVDLEIVQTQNRKPNNINRRPQIKFTKLSSSWVSLIAL